MTGHLNDTRRDFFSRIGDGLYGAALAYLIGVDLLPVNHALGAPAPAASPIYDLTPKRPHFPAKAKSVIQLFMNGGPSQVDLLDPKPALEKYAGQPPSRDLASQIRAVVASGGMMPSPFKFAKHGKSGIEVSELLPHLAKHVDDIAIIRSMFTTTISHNASLFLMQTGRNALGRPSLGSWVVYGLGSESHNLPAYVILDDPKGLPVNGIQNWEAGYLPGVYQGTRIRSTGDPILNLRPTEESPSKVVELTRSLLRYLDDNHLQQRLGNMDLEARIASYELAARMQVAATDAVDISKESAATQDMYGMNDELTASYGRRCLMARRLVERGVRLVQIYIDVNKWDHHGKIQQRLAECCGYTDKPIGALLTDLKQRGLLDQTLVVWGGEFGRLPLAQGPIKTFGRDHGPAGFSVWMSGGGVKGGTIYGATDEFGYKATENPVSVHDFHATILAQLGLDYRRLVFSREGRDERITDADPARVVKEILT